MRWHWLNLWRLLKVGVSASSTAMPLSTLEFNCCWTGSGSGLVSLLLLLLLLRMLLLLLLLQPAGDVAAGASPAMLPVSVSFVCDFRAALGHFRTQYLSISGIHMQALPLTHMKHFWQTNLLHYPFFLCVNYAPVTTIVLPLKAGPHCLRIGPPKNTRKSLTEQLISRRDTQIQNSRLPMEGAVAGCVCAWERSLSYCNQRNFWFIFTAGTHKQMRQQITNSYSSCPHPHPHPIPSQLSDNQNLAMPHRYPSRKKRP